LGPGICLLGTPSQVTLVMQRACQSRYIGAQRAPIPCRIENKGVSSPLGPLYAGRIASPRRFSKQNCSSLTFMLGAAIECADRRVYSFRHGPLG
jgi:hypothetical protein